MNLRYQSLPLFLPYPFLLRLLIAYLYACCSRISLFFVSFLRLLILSFVSS